MYGHDVLSDMQQCDQSCLCIVCVLGVVQRFTDECHRRAVHARRMRQSAVFGVVAEGQRVVLCSHASCTDAWRRQSRHHVLHLQHSALHRRHSGDCNDSSDCLLIMLDALPVFVSTG